MTLCEQIGDWAAGLRPEALPASVLERTRLQSVAVGSAAHVGAESARPFAAAAPEGPVGDVYRLAAASIAHDWDDYLFMGHTGHSAVPTSWAFCDDPARATLAQVAANEVAGRLGAALFLGPHNGQFWSSIHCAGAATAAGIGLGLDGERLAHAVAISLYQPPYGLWPGFMGPPTKLLTAAEPAAQGARAALLAAEGVDGPLDVIESPRGVLTHLSFVRRPDMLGALGDVWLTDTLAFKAHPGCAYLQAAIDAALRADVQADEIAGIELDAGLLTCGMEALEAARGELSAVTVNFSAALSLAVAIVAGRLTHEELRPGWLAEHADEVRGLAARVRVRHDWEQTTRTLRGTLDAGASLSDVRPGDWARVRRRMRELNMDHVAVGWPELWELVARPTARRTLGGALRRVLRSPRGGSLAAIDTGRLRLTFPCRLRIRLRSGRSMEIEGEERGACGHPLAEQGEVVRQRAEVTGAHPALA